jgi:hypothetical protein
VVRWADAQVVAADHPPQEVLDLSLDGPEKCLRRAEADFPARPVCLSFSQAFALKAITTRLESEDSVLDFAEWVSRGAMGEDLSLPEVALGYQLDHLLSDCEDFNGAVVLVRSKLPSLLPACKLVAAPFLEKSGA